MMVGGLRVQEKWTNIIRLSILLLGMAKGWVTKSLCLRNKSNNATDLICCFAYVALCNYLWLQILALGTQPVRIASLDSSSGRCTGAVPEYLAVLVQLPSNTFPTTR